jgi:hypothetical protein
MLIVVYNDLFAGEFRLENFVYNDLFAGEFRLEN